MIFLLLVLSCGNDSQPIGDRGEKKARREERKSQRQEQYQIVINDLANTKNDMKCIKQYITVQQKTPDEKLDYDKFETNSCQKLELIK